MKDPDGNHVLEPYETDSVPLDRYDRGLIQEALLWYADEQLEDEEAKGYCKAVANHVFHYDRE